MLKLVFEPTQKEENEKIILNGLAEYTLDKTGVSPDIMSNSFHFFYKDEKEEIQAGIIGFCYCGCVYISMLWVHPRYRGQKLGVALVEEAEKLGKQQGCSFSTVNTMEWEAPEFYKKLGYEVEFKREGYADNHIMFFLRKSL